MKLRLAKTGYALLPLLTIWIFVGCGSSLLADSMTELSHQFQAEHVAADFIVLVDTSKSMEGTRFAAVRASLSALAQGLKPGDFFCVIGVDKRAHDLIPRHSISAGEIPSLLTAIKNIPEPYAVPDYAAGEKGATDLRVGLEELLQQLTHLRASSLQFVFLLTDGHHQPPHPSKGDAQLWRNLSLSGKEATGSGGVQVEWLWFDASASTEHIRRVFPDAVPMVVTPQALKSHFGRLKDDIKMRKLRLQVRREIASGRVCIDPNPVNLHIGYGNAQDIPIRIQSNFRCLNVQARLRTQPRFSSKHGIVTLFTKRPNGSLTPGGTQEIATARIVHRAESPALYVLSCLGLCRIADVKQRISVPVSLTLQPEATLRRLDPSLQMVHNVDLAVQVNALVSPPVPVWLTYLCLISLVTLVAVAHLTKKRVIRWPRLRLRMRVRF